MMQKKNITPEYNYYFEIAKSVFSLFPPSINQIQKEITNYALNLDGSISRIKMSILCYKTFLKHISIVDFVYVIKYILKIFSQYLPLFISKHFSVIHKKILLIYKKIKLLYLIEKFKNTECFFWGYGEVYQNNKKFFAKAKVRAILVNIIPSIGEKETIDGLPIIFSDEILPYTSPLPILIFAKPKFLIQIVLEIKRFPKWIPYIYVCPT